MARTHTQNRPSMFGRNNKIYNFEKLVQRIKKRNLLQRNVFRLNENLWLQLAGVRLTFGVDREQKSALGKQTNSVLKQSKLQTKPKKNKVHNQRLLNQIKINQTNQRLTWPFESKVACFLITRQC